MEIQDQRAARAAALSAARRRLARLKVAAVAGSVLAFAGLSAGMALRSTIKVVASSSSVASLPVSATSGAPAAPAPAAVGATPSATATATPVAAPAPTAATAAKATVHIVSAQS